MLPSETDTPMTYKMYGVLTEDGTWSSVFHDSLLLEMSGYDKPVALSVTVLPEEEQDCYFGWREMDGTLSLVFQTDMQVQLCSPDFFKSAIERGEGRIAPLSITETQP